VISRVAAIARANLLRTLRDRLGLFFVVILPLILIVVLGITYGGQGSVRVGVADADASALSGDLVDALGASTEATLEIRRYDTPADLADAVARGYVNFGLAIRSGYDAALRGGGVGEVEYLSPPTTGSSAVRSLVERAVAGQEALVRAARFAMVATGATFDDALVAAQRGADRSAGVDVSVESVAVAADGPSGFSIGAQSQLILFMFLTSLTGATELILSRQLGISRRMVATPTSTATIILGEGVGRLGLALFQGAFIVLASALLFNVEWADPVATAAIVIVFAFVAAGAAMLIGTLARNASQAGALGPALGLTLGLLGGTMVPPEVFPETMRTLAHVTPHAWAMDAFRALLLRGAGLVDIVPDLAVLALFAAVLLGLAGLRFRRLIVRGAI
jgi:linearmycin/streptolysin S transport system permease protein